MKHLSLFVVAVMLAAAACQRESIDTVDAAERAAVSVTVELPAQSLTKGMSEADFADIVYYEVWNSDWTKQYFPVNDAGLASAQVSGRTATIELILVKNQTYNFIFWACNEASGAYDVSSLKNVKVDYSLIARNGNNDSYDAFYSVNTFKVGTSLDETVVLRRPFAQLNFGASKMNTSFGEIVLGDTEVTVSNLATVFDTRNGVGTVPTDAPVTFKANSIATEELLQTNGSTYSWITMDYMLMNDESDAVTVEASFELEGSGAPVCHTIHNVPLKKNYRTNIVGDLFTSDALLEIIVDHVFDEPDSNVDPLK